MANEKDSIGMELTDAEVHDLQLNSVPNWCINMFGRMLARRNVRTQSPALDAGLANEKEVDPELVKRADYAYNPHPADAQAPALDAAYWEHIRAIGKQMREAADRMTQAPALDAGLVERMLDAWTQAKDQDFSGTRGDCLVCMTAALRVAADALLADTTAEEVSAFRKRFPQMPDPIAATFNCYIGFRRARLLAPVKSADERVRIEVVHTGLGRQENRLFCDGCEIKPADVLEYARLGLIATLQTEPRP